MTNKPVIYDAAAFVCSFSIVGVCENLKTTVITYSHKGVPIHWLIIKARVNSFDRLITDINNENNFFDFIEFKWEDIYLSYKV